MRRLGTVTRVAGGLAVVRVPEDDAGLPEIGATVVDADLATVGRVVDVFGPVDRPYLGVASTDGVDPAALLGDPVYAR